MDCHYEGWWSPFCTVTYSSKLSVETDLVTVCAVCLSYIPRPSYSPSYLYTLLMATVVMVIISQLQCVLHVHWRWHENTLRFPLVCTTVGTTWWNIFLGLFVAHLASTCSYMLSEVWTGCSTMCLIKKTCLPPSFTVSTSSQCLLHPPLPHWHYLVFICTESFLQ
jgi:hypothetical protein